MKDYLFKIMVNDETHYRAVLARNIAEARKHFADISAAWPKGWCLLGVYRQVS